MTSHTAKVKFLPPIPRGITDRPAWAGWIRVHRACAAKSPGVRSSLFDSIDDELSGHARALTLLTLTAAKFHPRNPERGKPMWGGYLAYEVEKDLSSFREHCDDRWVSLKDIWLDRGQ
jgi:hypothetical protein